jgi:hypothetical protein
MGCNILSLASHIASELMDNTICPTSLWHPLCGWKEFTVRTVICVIILAPSSDWPGSRPYLYSPRQDRNGTCPLMWSSSLSALSEFSSFASDLLSSVQSYLYPSMVFQNSKLWCESRSKKLQMGRVYRVKQNELAFFTSLSTDPNCWISSEVYCMIHSPCS